MVRNLYLDVPVNLQKLVQQVEVKVPTLLQPADLHIVNFVKLVEKGHRSGETLKKWHGTRKKLESLQCMLENSTK